MKVSDMMNDAYQDELLNLEPVDVDTNAIKNNVFNKLNLSSEDIDFEENRTVIDNSISASLDRRRSARTKGATNKKSSKRALRTVAIVAAIMIGGTGIVYAASELLGMGKQDVDFFDKNGTGSTEVNSATYFAGLETALEEFNATVGESMTEDGRTVTLDSVSVDDNYINGFFTVTYDEPIDLNANEYMRDYDPGYSKLRIMVPDFTIKIDGKYTDGLLDAGENWPAMGQSDPYMLDDKTVKMVVRWPIGTMLPDTFALSIGTISYFENNTEIGDEGTYHFDVAIDKTASSAYTRAVEPGKYTFDTTEGPKTLTLEKLAITPFGGIISVMEYWVKTSEISPFDGKEYSGGALDPSCISLSRLYITDDKGNVINSTEGYIGSGMSASTGINTKELIGIAPDAKTLTLAPVIYEEPQFDDNGFFLGYEGSEDRTYSVNDIGAKIELDKLGGYYLEDYIVEDARVSLVLRPYGKCDYLTGSIVIDTDNVSLAEGSHSGLLNEQLDRATGFITLSIDFYAATPDELKAITTFHARYENIGIVDEAASITIPIE